MKKIALAPRLRRMIASIIDLIILLGMTTLIYLTAVMPFVFDANQIRENDKKAYSILRECSLNIADDDNQALLAKFEADEVRELKDLYDVDIKFAGKTYTDISIVKDVYTFYTAQYVSFGGEKNLNLEEFNRDILKVGQPESNIKAFDNTTYQFELIEPKNESKTFRFMIVTCRDIGDKIAHYAPLAELEKQNSAITRNAILFVLPVLFGFSLIFNFIIPICSPNGQTIGKWITGLIVLDKDGYVLKKSWYIPRWLVYIFLEVIGGIATFGGIFLISYTMFMFAKKRRCLHDMLSNSCVADGRDSIFFKNPQEERYFMERRDKLKFKGLLNEKTGQN